MKKINFPLSLQIFLCLIFLFSLNGCQPEEPLVPGEEIIQSDLKANQSDPSEKVNDFYGPTQPMGKGVVRSVVSINHDGEPVAVGVVFTEKALENLPDTEINLTLQLHNKAEDLIVNHIDFGYNPQGHPGPDFAKEHFDVHFYWISEEEKLSIPFAVGMNNLPDASIWPVEYEPEGVTIPQMGMHWLHESVLDPAYTFDQTFIYGSYNSEFTFYEPMITMEYLKARNFEESYEIIPLGAYEEPAYYANSYEIEYDSVKKQYRVMLTDLFWAGGS